SARRHRPAGCKIRAILRRHRSGFRCRFVAGALPFFGSAIRRTHLRVMTALSGTAIADQVDGFPEARAMRSTLRLQKSQALNCQLHRYEERPVSLTKPRQDAARLRRAETRCPVVCTIFPARTPAPLRRSLALAQ